VQVDIVSKESGGKMSCVFYWIVHEVIQSFNTFRDHVLSLIFYEVFLHDPDLLLVIKTQILFYSFMWENLRLTEKWEHYKEHIFLDTLSLCSTTSNYSIVH
jgi:hypothetical protein